MKKVSHAVILFGSILISADGAPVRLPNPAVGRETASLHHEVRHAIDRGSHWLEAQQKTNGSWSSSNHPALTALSVRALAGVTAGPNSKALSAGLRYLLACIQSDGSIHQGELLNYNTALSLSALAAVDASRYQLEIRHARRWLISQQVDLGEKGKVDSPFDGGIGYGSKYEHSDMNNTLTALEALYFSRPLERDGGSSEPALNWAAAIEFLQNCQNLRTVNRQAWVSDDPRNRGGFVYYPGVSMAGQETNRAGGISLRSYGSVSYAGLLSYAYADLKPTDPRVVGVMDWLRGNFSLSENPRMGMQGYYYYIYLMTRALHLQGLDELLLADGSHRPWRKDIALKLINLQSRDGSWTNENGRWWEKDPVLVTAYCLLALETIESGWR